jgi:uncharacterized metal-binding protein
MPSGKVHDQITAVGALVALPVWWYLAPAPVDWRIGGTLVVATLFSGWFLSPDLDLDSSIYRRWGPLRFLWLPYQKLVPHRSWISHSWLLSPLMRVGYLLGTTWLLALLALWALRQGSGIGPGSPQQTPLDLVQDLYRHYPKASLAGLVGLIYGTVLHTGADTLSTFFKKRF